MGIKVTTSSKAKMATTRFYGQSGRDILRGGFGNDILRGGLGNDTLRGGLGKTHCAEALMTTRSKAKNRVTFSWTHWQRPSSWTKGEMAKKFLVDWVTIPCAGAGNDTLPRVAKVQIGTVFQRCNDIILDFNPMTEIQSIRLLCITQLISHEKDLIPHRSYI